MFRNLHSLIAVLLASVLGASAATNGAIENLETEVLAKFKGATPTTIIQVLGPPNTTVERDGKEYLSWESAKSSGTYVYGVGVSESYSCKATFEFVDGALAKVSLFGAAGSDRSLCKKLMKPLLSESTPAGASSGAADPKAGTAAEAAVLTNGDILKLTAAGLPDSIILAKIKESTCRFDVSTDALVALKQAGVRDPIIEAMMTITKKK